jgi:hypothetical protein
MKKLRGGNMVVNIIWGIIKFVIYVVLAICVLLFMIMALSIIAIGVGVYIFLQKTLEVINIVTGGITAAINPIFSGITTAFSFIKDIPKIVAAAFKGRPYRPSSSGSTNYKIPKIPTRPEEIIYKALGIPPQEKAKPEKDEEDDEFCSAN